MKASNPIVRRGATAALAGFTLLLGAACAPGTGETTKDLAVEAVQDVLTNPLGAGAPLAGVVLGVDKIGLDAVRRTYEARGAAAEIKAAEAGSISERDRYEQESRLWDAARTCLITRDCAELKQVQKEYRDAALLGQAGSGGAGSSGGGGGGHSD